MAASATPGLGIHVGGHVDLFYRDLEDQASRPVLVHTSRPCARCGYPLVGLVVDDLGRPGVKVHATCRRTGNRG